MILGNRFGSTNQKARQRKSRSTEVARK